MRVCVVGVRRLGFVLATLSTSGLAATLRVGPGLTYAKPCAAFAAAGDGDTIEIDATGNGSYDGDVCAIARSGLTIRGTNGRARVDAAGQNAQGKAIWVVQGGDTTIENVELSGAAVPDDNGAGIRAEGANLTIRGSYFHDNQEGILGGAGEVLIETSEFARNGNCINPAGCAHNLYIGGSVTKFTLRYSYSHAVTDGHLVKSRAQSNFILYNRLTGEDGTDSYELSLPNGGTTYVVGNVIEQGPSTGNSTIVDYGSEGPTNAGHDLYVVNNTIVNDRPGGGTFISVASAVSTPAVVKNNAFVGPGTPVSQATAVVGHNFTGDPLFVNAPRFDYRLLPGSPCIDAGADPGGAATGVSLLPVYDYVHPARFEARVTVGTIDVGAYEFGSIRAVGPDGGVLGGGPTDGGGKGGAAGAVTSGTATGGAAGLGGATMSAGGTGNRASGGASSGASGASTRTGGPGDAGTRTGTARDPSGCGCRMTPGRDASGAALGLLALAGLGRWRRRRFPGRSEV